MDVNGTQFHLLLGQDDWLGDETLVVPGSGLEWSEADNTVRLTELPFLFPDRVGDRLLGPEDRRGADRDQFGHWYWIGPDHDEILILPNGAAEPARFWPPVEPVTPADPNEGAFGPKEPGNQVIPTRFSGLAVTDHHYLIVGLPDLPGLLIFDLHGGGSPSEYPWPAPFAPVDLAAAPNGGVWILDNADPTVPGPARYWGLDRYFNICNLTSAAMPPDPTADFRPKTPVDEPDERATASFASTAMGVDLAAVQAVAIEAMPDGSVLILDRATLDHGALLRYRGADLSNPQLPLPLLGGKPTDIAFLPSGDGLAGTVYVSEDQGDQAFAFELGAAASSLTRLNRYLPMRLFAGKGLVAADGGVYYDMSDRWLQLVDRVRSRYGTSATLTTRVFDAADPGATWHRLLLDGRLPPGSAVAVESRAHDEPAGLAVASWTREPDLYLRGEGSEIGYHRFGESDTPGAGTWELLLQRAAGRYLQLRLTITGNGRVTPRLWSLRAYAPRFSYLKEYLPDVYQEDRDSASFHDRYLANVEGMLTAWEGRIERAQVLFDVTTLDRDYLSWLASWLGATTEPGWDEARQRLFIQHAFDLFGRRGTRRGMTEAIRLAIEPCPDSSIFDPASTSPFGVRIVESFRSRSTPGVVFGDPTELIGPRVVEVGEKWQLTDGRIELERRYRAFLADLNGSTAGPTENFPPLTPQEPQEKADRDTFIARELAITYADVTAQNVDDYRAFLHQRYRRPMSLNAAWNLAGASAITSFDDIALPTAQLPADGAPLQDWIQFVSAHLPIRRAAHRFTVLVPIRPEDNDAVRSARLDTVERIVDIERPSHTAFDVKPYWAAFRVGEVRVGLETIVGEGSRFVAIILGHGRIAQSYLGAAHPWNVEDRWVVGREKVSNGHST